jgi:type IV secretion system protein VirB3
MSEKALYSPYAGLGRVAMIKGVPLMAGLIAFGIGVVVALTGAYLFGPAGFLLSIPCLAPVIFIKQVCATDDQALHILVLEVRCFLGRTNARMFGNTYTLSPMKYGYRHDVFKQAFERTPSMLAHEEFRSDFSRRKES